MKRTLGAVAVFGVTALIAGCGGSSKGVSVPDPAGYVGAGSYVGSIVGINSGNQTMELLRVNVGGYGAFTGQLLPLLNGAGATPIDVTGTYANGTLTLIQASGTETGVVTTDETTCTVSGNLNDTGSNVYLIEMSRSSGTTTLAGTYTGTLTVADTSTFTPTISIEANGNGGMTYTGGGGEAFVDQNNRLYMDYEPTAGGVGHVLICNLTATNSGVVLSNSLQYTPGLNTALGVFGKLN